MMDSQDHSLTSSPPIRQQVTFIYVQDLARSDAFYGGVLGLKQVLDQGACHIYQTAESAFLGFCRETGSLEGVRSDAVILTLVVDSSAEVDAWERCLRAVGAESFIQKAPALNERFNIYHLFLRDPDGYLVEIQAFLDPAWPRAAGSKEL